jgi:hypothetical protein
MNLECATDGTQQKNMTHDDLKPVRGAAVAG